MWRKRLKESKEILGAKFARSFSQGNQISTQRKVI